MQIYILFYFQCHNKKAKKTHVKKFLFLSLGLTFNNNFGSWKSAEPTKEHCALIKLGRRVCAHEDMYKFITPRHHYIFEMKTRSIDPKFTWSEYFNRAFGKDRCCIGWIGQFLIRHVSWAFNYYERKCIVDWRVRWDKLHTLIKD